jgi:8-oxo-dGDP phosphatase
MSRRLPDDPKPWTVLHRRYIYNRAPWLVIRQDHVRLPNGREIPEFWVQEFPPWVSVVAITPKDEIVLVRQFRAGLAQVHYELPAGVADAEEEMEAAARRELAEETGFGGGRWRPFLRLSPNSAIQNNLSHTFIAEGVTRVAEPTPDGTEDLRVHLVPLADVRRLIDEGEIVQALHAAPLLRYLLDRQT